MAVSAKVGSFNIGTGEAASTVAVTGLGFQPKWILFWWSGLTAASNGTRTTSYRGMGWACSSSDFACATTRDTDNVGTAATARGMRQDACIAQLSDAGDFSAGTSVGAGWADLQSFDGNGFTLEIIDAFAVDLYVSYLAIGGTSITNVESGVLAATGVAPANQTVNNVGNFQPDVTFFLSIMSTSNAPTASTDSSFMVGVGRGTTDYVWAGGSNNSSATGDTGAYCLGGECIVGMGANPAGAPVDRAEFVSHNAGPGGFTINWIERANAIRVLWCSLKGGDWTLGDFLTNTDTVTLITEGSFASTPSAVLAVSAGNAQTTQDATPAAQDKWSIGAATSASERVVQYVDSRDGNTDMFVHLAARSDAIYENTDPAQTSYTEVGRGDLVSMDANGFTAIMDDADPAQAFAWYVAVGPAAAGASAFPHYYYQQMRR